MNVYIMYKSINQPTK